MADRILVIEDNPPGLLALSEALRIKLPGMLVDTAGSAESGLAQLASDQYECVICDVLMPGLDGIELLAFVRQHQPELSVVMVTAGEFVREAEALSKGAFAFLPKPLDLDLLLRTVREAVERTKEIRAFRKRNVR